MGDKDLLKKLFEESVVFEKPHYEKEKRVFVTVRNLSDISFRLKKTDNSKSGYPEYIDIPAGGTNLLTLPNDGGTSIRYTVENTITGVDEKLIVNLF